MSFVLVNVTTGPAVAVVLDDLGITVPASGTLDITDMSPSEISMSATGGDLETAINAGDILVQEPRDGYPGPNLNAADSLIAAQVANDAHVGIRLANISDLDDVNTSGASSTDVLQLNGSGVYVPVTPSTLAGDIALGDLSDVDDGTAHTAGTIYVYKGDGTNLDVVDFSADADVSEAVEDIIGAMGIDGTDTTFTYNDTNGTIEWSVDDVFLRNTGDTLDSGTLTIASGASINIATGGDLTISDAPVNGTDAVNKDYVDSVAAGLDPKESVRYCTVLDVSGTYSSSGGTGGTGAFTAVDFTDSSIFDGLDAGAIAIGDRILVKSQTQVSGFAEASIAGAPLGTVVPGIAASTFDFDVTIDGGSLQQLSITTPTALEDYNAIAALMSAQVVGGAVGFVSGAFFVTSTSTGNSSTVVVAAGTAGSGGGDLFAAITAAAAGNPAITFPTPTAGTASTENGIYVVTTAGATGAMGRASDQDGSPASEVSGGNYTFVENGTTCANTGWVLQGDGVLTLNTDPMSWVQFSESSTFSAGDGLALNGSVFSMDINNMTSATIALGDEIAFNDVSSPDTPQNTTVQDMLNDLNIPYNITGTGIMVQTGDDTYTKVSIAVDGAGALDGLAIANADGTGGNPTVGLDINGLPIRSDAVDGADRLAVYNITTGANEYYTVTEIANAGAANAFGIITGDTGTATADSPADTVGFTGSGITITATAGATAAVAFALDIPDLVNGAETLVLTDTIAVFDGTDTLEYSFQDVVDDLDIPTGIGAGVGFVTSDGSGNYTTVTIAADATEDLDGLAVTPTDGSSNTLIGLDIDGMTASAEDMAATDEFPVHNKSQGTGGANRNMTGQEIADGVATILSLPTGLAVTTINTQEVLTLIDTTRSNKVLSVETTAVTWSENRIGNNDWVQIGNANDSNVGYIIPMNATIVKISAHTTDDNNNTKDIDLYIDDVSSTTGIVSFSPATNGQNEYSNVALNIDVNANQKIQLRGASTGGPIEDTVITIWLKWRG